MMAYWLTERQQLAKASMLRMTEGFAADWLMDAPLKSFGTTTWASSSGDTLLTYDAFGHASAMVRGMFEYLYEATTLELVPHQPDNITQVTQDFGVRWGPYRLFISAVGVRSSGIAAVAVNGAALKPPHRFNATSLTLEFAAMPKPTAAAAAAVESDISTAVDRIAVQITYTTKAAPAPSPAPAPAPAPTASGVPADYALRLAASDLAAAGLKPGQAVESWTASPSSHAPHTVATAQPGAGGAPVLVMDGGVAGVQFDGRLTML